MGAFSLFSLKLQHACKIRWHTQDRRGEKDLVLKLSLAFDRQTDRLISFLMFTPSQAQRPYQSKKRVRQIG